MSLREEIRRELEQLERLRVAALTRAEAARAEAAAYAAVAERLERLAGLALADEAQPPVPPVNGSRVRREPLVLSGLNDPPPPAPGGTAPAKGKGSPPCPACGGATIVRRTTGAILCLDEECKLSRTGRDEAAARARPAPPPPAEEPEGGGNAIDIGAGRQDLPEGTNLATCVAAIRRRAPHWLTTSGILEVVRAHLRSELPETMTQIIAQEMNKQRKLRTYTVPGLQARQVDARRWEYRIVGLAKPEGD